MKNDRILRRVKGLLKVAEGNANMEESHTAFLQAQRMMIKYGVDPSEITDDEEMKDVLTKAGSNYKRLFWWERQLAHIVAKNFRCKDYYNGRYFEGKSQIQRQIRFMGIEGEVLLANAMFSLVVDAIQFYTNRYIKANNISGSRAYTMQEKNDYMKGFICGLEDKFEEQIVTQEWGLVLVIPKEVEVKYKEVVTGKSIPMSIPETGSYESYRKGYEDGNAIDYKKETIDGKDGSLS